MSLWISSRTAERQRSVVGGGAIWKPSRAKKPGSGETTLVTFSYDLTERRRSFSVGTCFAFDYPYAVQVIP
jgi:hypothetical protein